MPKRNLLPMTDSSTGNSQFFRQGAGPTEMHENLEEDFFAFSCVHGLKHKPVLKVCQHST